MRKVKATMDELIPFLRARLDEDERAANAWLPLGNPTAAQRDHIARHDPARVLADVAAKREILRLAEIYADEQFPNHDGGYADGMADAVALLAASYADHPDYREEWRP